MPISGLSAAGRGTEVDRRTLDLIATVIERCEVPGEPGQGHPPAATVRVLATLRRFLREGTPWRGLRATPMEASGSTLRRRLADWAAVNLLQRVHAVLVAMCRAGPPRARRRTPGRRSRAPRTSAPGARCGTRARAVFREHLAASPFSAYP